MAYDAFISYSHTADGRLAPAVQAGLQRLARPWYRMRALRVFRDETGLAVNPHLWGSIETALDESEYFVLLASPEAAASPWVAREIEHWMATKPVDRILPVLTDGDLVWDSSTGAYDMARSNALPSILATAFLAEPRHLDVRWARTEAQLDLRHADFRAAIAALAAPMHGVSRDELEGEDVTQHRRTMRIAWGAAALLLFVTIAAMVSASFAVSYASSARENERRALAERAHARRSAEEATAQRTLAVQNASAARSAQDEAETNATEASQNAAEATLQRALAEKNAQESAQNAAEAQANGQEAEEQTIAAQQNAAEASANAERASANATRAEANAARAATNAAAAAKSAEEARDAAEVAAAQRERAQQNATEAREQRAEAVASATVARSRQLAASALNALGTNPDRSLLMSVQANRFDPNSQARDSSMRTLQRQPRGLRAYLPIDPAVGRVSQLLTSPDHRVLATIGSTGRISLTDLASGTRLATPTVATSPVRGDGVWFSPDSAWLVLRTADSLVLWDIEAGHTAGTIPTSFGFVTAAAISANHELLAATALDGIHVLPVTPGGGSGSAEPIALPEGFTPSQLAFSPDRQMLAVSGIVGFDTQAQVLVFSTGTGQPIAALPADTGDCACVDPRGTLELRFDDGSTGATLTSVAFGAADFTLISWDVGSWNRIREASPSIEALTNRETVAAVDVEHARIITNSAFDSVARVRNLESGEVIGTLDAHLAFCPNCGTESRGALAFGPSDTIVAAGSDKLLRRFDLSRLSDRVAAHVPIGISAFNNVAVSADGRVTAVLGSLGLVSVFSTGDGHLITTLVPPALGRGWIVLSSDGSTLVVATAVDDGNFEEHYELSAMDVATGAVLWNRRTEVMSAGGIAIDPSGQLLAVIFTPDPFDPAAKNSLELLDVATGNLIAAQTIETWYWRPSFSADGRLVAVGSFNPDIPLILYGVTERRIVRTLDDAALLGSFGLVFSADGRVAVALPNGGTGMVVLDATTFAITGEIDAAGSVSDLAISADGDLIAASIAGQATQLFDTGAGEAFGDPVGPAIEGGPGTHNLVFSPRDRTLVMYSGPNLFRVDLDPSSWEGQACAIAGRNLTRREWTALLGDDVDYQRTCPEYPGGP